MINGARDIIVDRHVRVGARLLASHAILHTEADQRVPESRQLA